MKLQDVDYNSTKMTNRGTKIYEAARSSVSHLRPRTSKGFLQDVEREIREVEKYTVQDSIFHEVKQILEINWALAVPFFQAAKHVPAEEEFIINWSKLAQPGDNSTDSPLRDSDEAC